MSNIKGWLRCLLICVFILCQTVSSRRSFTTPKLWPFLALAGKGLHAKSTDTVGQCAPQTPFGLRNLGNTCYMNSLLQGLFNSKHFRERVKSHEFVQQTEGDALSAVFQIMAHGNRLSKEPVSRYFAEAMNVNIGVQEDSEEFFLKVLDSVDNSAVNAATLDGDSYRVSNSFKTELEQTISCTNILHKSTTKQTYFDLSIDLHHKGEPAKPHTELTAALADYFTPEALTGDSRYKTKDHGYQNAVKSVAISKLPNVLALHLKRFAFDPQTYDMTKINSPVDIPLELDMTPFLTQPNGDGDDDSTDTDTAEETKENDAEKPLYDLSSIIIHEGDSLDHGHYFAIVRPQPTLLPDVWYLVNDHVVTCITTKEALRIASGKERIIISESGLGASCVVGGSSTSCNIISVSGQSSGSSTINTGRRKKTKRHGRRGPPPRSAYLVFYEQRE